MSVKDRKHIIQSGHATTKAAGMDADAAGPSFVDYGIKPGDISQANPQTVSEGRLADHYPEFKAQAKPDDPQTQDSGH